MLRCLRVTDGSEREESCRPAAEGAALLAGLALVTEHVDIGNTRCYPDALARHWQSAGAEHEGLLLLEGDKRPFPWALCELRDCPHPWCCWAYPCYPHKTGLPAEVLAQRNVRRGETVWCRMADLARDPWCERTGLGLVRFGPALTQHVPPIGIDTVFRSTFDAEISDRCRELLGPCHVHLPVMTHIEPGHGWPPEGPGAMAP